MQEKEVKTKLSEIKDPLTGASITELGIVKSIQINEDHKHIYVSIHMPHHMRALQSYVETQIKDKTQTLGYVGEIEIQMRQP